MAGLLRAWPYKCNTRTGNAQGRKIKTSRKEPVDKDWALAQPDVLYAGVYRKVYSRGGGVLNRILQYRKL